MKLDTIDSVLVQYGRLKKKFERVKKQRDYHQQMHEYYAKVISMQPFLETRWKSYEERKALDEKRKMMESRIKEQELLIQLLSNGEIPPYKIDQAYNTLIKTEYAKMNEKNQ